MKTAEGSRSIFAAPETHTNTLDPRFYSVCMRISRANWKLSRCWLMRLLVSSFSACFMRPVSTDFRSRFSHQRWCTAVTSPDRRHTTHMTDDAREDQRQVAVVRPLLAFNASSGDRRFCESECDACAIVAVSARQHARAFAQSPLQCQVRRQIRRSSCSISSISSH